jgi:hypothetical protein
MLHSLGISADSPDVQAGKGIDAYPPLDDSLRKLILVRFQIIRIRIVIRYRKEVVIQPGLRCPVDGGLIPSARGFQGEPPERAVFGRPGSGVPAVAIDFAGIGAVIVKNRESGIG